MSITLITGVPGSGKTLYAIDKILRSYVGATSDKILDDGFVLKIQRIIYTNINGLLIDHEKIEGSGEWKKSGSEWSFTGENDQGLRNWHNWAKPGSLICFDEFQKCWPPRPNGAPIPPDIQTLDTHRHMGVDFLLITQNCMNIDRHVLGLVDRHLHIRRVANMPMAVVYEWDHASKSLLYKNSITKSAWRYDKSVFKLYKSAELHTKQARKMPGLVWFILIGLAGVAYAIPSLKNRLTDRVTQSQPGKASPAVQAASAPLKPGEKITSEYVKDGIKYTVETVQNPLPAASSPARSASDSVTAQRPAPIMAGCFQSPANNVCACLDTTGAKIETEPGFCESKIRGYAAPGQKSAEITAPNPMAINSGTPSESTDPNLIAFTHTRQIR